MRKLGSYRTASAGNCLVTTPRVTAKGDVVHAALRRGAGTKSFQYHVHYPLGGEHIASDDSCVIAGIQNRAFGDDYLDWR